MNRRIEINQPILADNDLRAAAIREVFQRHNVIALELVSSPGSGKTTLLEHTLEAMKDRLNIAVLAGDVQSHNDAMRIRAAGGRSVVALETGGACHLEAAMIQDHLGELDLAQTDLLFIENVGNLVCPAAFDLGEHMKISLLSTVEGDDKPLKYPIMFRNTSVLVITKTDMLGLTDFSMERAKQNALRVNPELQIFELSCKSGEGMTLWFEWLAEMPRRSVEISE